MTGPGLRARLVLHERSMGWLGRKLGVARPTVWKWVHEQAPIPAVRVEQIERLLPRERSGSV